MKKIHENITILNKYELQGFVWVYVVNEGVVDLRCVLIEKKKLYENSIVNKHVFKGFLWVYVSMRVWQELRNMSEVCVFVKYCCTTINTFKIYKHECINNTEYIITCFRAFLLCFCEGEMSLLVGTEGEEHRGCGDDGCDCNLEGTMKYKSTTQMLQNPLPEGGVLTLSHHAFVLMKLKPLLCTKKQITLPF